MTTLLLWAALMASPGVTPANLRCEYRVNPQGVDSVQPRLSWTLNSSERGQSQSAYQILVASSSAALDGGQADEWDSGKVASHESIGIPYGGKPLSSHLRCYWKVRTWDQNGASSEWSPAASWSMGILHPEDWQATWVAWSRTAINSGPLPMFRREFSVARKVPAPRPTSPGWGFSSSTSMGAKWATTSWNRAGPITAAPTYTRPTMLEISCAPGLTPSAFFWGMACTTWRAAATLSSPRVLAAPNSSCIFASSTTMERRKPSSRMETGKSRPSPTRFSCIYGGEDYDARQEQPGWNEPGFARQGWEAAEIVDDSTERPVFAITAAHQGDAGFPTVKVSEPAPGIHVYDLGQNFAGWPQITVRGKAGAPGSPHPRRALDGKGFVSQRSSGGPEYFSYTLRAAAARPGIPDFPIMVSATSRWKVMPK